MNVGIVNINNALSNGQSSLLTAKNNTDEQKFNELVKRLQSQNEGNGTLASNQIAQDGRLNGEYTTGYSGTFSSASDKNALPTGAAANQANPHIQSKTIDKTSKLYESALELEGYFVKQMLSAMRKTVSKAYEGDFATQTYEDMLFDEYATAMTKNAGFGLADQIYLSLV